MKINNKHKGFTLIEYVMAIVLTLSLTLLISKISIGFIYTMKSASVNISQRENAQVIEKIIKSELESDSYISSMYIEDIGNVKAEVFTESDILVLYYKTKKSTGGAYNINAVNFIKDKNKIFIRKNLFSENNSLGSIGGYEIASGVKNCYLEKTGDNYKFVVELIDNNFIYKKEIYIDKTNSDI